VIELLREMKSFGLDLSHNIVPIQADVTTNDIRARGRVWAVAVMVYDKKPPVGFQSAPHTLHGCLRVVEVYPSEQTHLSRDGVRLM
jgi:hypothetical protein